MKKNASSSSDPFGPQLQKNKQIDVNKKVKKMIHYDCDIELDEDIPNEDEIYIKENLLNKKHGESNTDNSPGDDLSIVNINVSVLYSSSGGDNSNSKNSVTLTYSSDSRIKNSTSNSKLSPNNQVNQPQSNLVHNNLISNKIDANKFKEATYKMKVLPEKKLSGKNKINNHFNQPKIEKSSTSPIIINSKTQLKTKDDFISNLESSEELIDLIKDVDSVPGKANSNSHVNITNITNIIVETKSFDIKTPSNDMMLRDIKALHVITQKALSTHSKHNPIDSFDEERRNFLNFKNINSKKALFIDDNSDLPSGINNQHPYTTTSRSKSITIDKEKFSNSFSENRNDTSKNAREQIINIININNNYNIGAINMNNYFSINHNSDNSKKTFRTANIKNFKTQIPNENQSNTNTNNINDTPINSAHSNMSNKIIKKMIPKNKTTSHHISNKNPSNKSLKDIIKTFKTEQKNEKFIKLAK